jgi:DNA-binding HxlR family transcriptional regulator
MCYLIVKSMARRTYAQHCGLARALDVVGERWTLLVVRELLLAPRRYGDLLAELPGITTNLLAKRLAELEKEGLVEKVERARPTGGVVYRLTEGGAALEPAIMELARWGGRYLVGGPRRGDRLDVGWGLLSMKRRYLGGITLEAGIVVGEREFHLSFTPTGLVVHEAPARPAEVIVTTDAKGLLAWLFSNGDPKALRREGVLSVSGEEESWRTLLRAFAPRPLPPPLLVPARPT